MEATSTADPAALRIFIGSEDSQIVAHRVLEYSIRAHSSVPVEITPMLDLAIPVPSDPENRSRVGFSFTRFVIPQLCGYQGRALYLDADMLVLGDVAELAELPFGGNKLLCSYQTDRPAKWKDKATFRPGRHTAVMLLDCSRLPWKIEEVIGGLDEGRYTYEQLVHELCLVEPAEIADTIPPEWNHLERYDPGLTRLVHFTVVHTQPWRSNANPLGALWTRHFAAALQAGAVSPEEVVTGIAAGHLKPALESLLELAPGRGERLGADEAARELAIARMENSQLRARLAGLQSSQSWRLGSALVGAANACRSAGRRAMGGLGRGGHSR